jgi:hypothetical protein
MAQAPKTWILTGSPDNFRATREMGFTLVGAKERRRNQAQAIVPGDRVVFYLTRVGRFAGSVRVTGHMFEDWEPRWPGTPFKKGRGPDAYPWRLPAEPEIVIADEREWIDAEELADDLEHVRKWPREHFRLAFQGQLRTVSDHDAELLAARLRDAAMAADRACAAGTPA